MGRRKKWSFLWIVIPVITTGIFFLLFVYYLIDPILYRNVIQKSLTLHLGREVTIGKAKFSVWGGLGVTFEDFRVRDRSQSFDLLHSKRLILKVKIIPLFRKEVKWKRVVLERPSLNLLRDRNGRLNFFDGPLTGEEVKVSQQKIIQTLSTLFGGSFILRDGEVSFSDESRIDSSWLTQIRSLDLRLLKVSYRKPFPFYLSGKVIHSQKEGKFSISGTVENIQEDMDLSKGKLEAKVEIKGIETSHFWPYLKNLLPMRKISGTFDLNGHYQGDLSGVFKTSAKIKIKDVAYDHPQVFAYFLNPKWLSIDFDVDYDRKDFKVSRFHVELPEIWVKGKGKIYGIGTEEIGIEAEAQSSPFDISDGRKYIPYRIITPDVSGPLFRSEGSGPVQIISVKLSGKIPEIEHCDQLKYAHTLSVEMKLNGARLKLPWNLPALEELKGHLLFKEGHLNLKEVEGRVLHSWIERADGIFYRLLHIPILQVHGEGKFDLADLLALAKLEGFSSDIFQILSPITSLTGRAQYQLSLKGELKPPLHFKHQGVYQLSKVRFTHSQIPFALLIGEGRINLSDEGLQWSGARVEFDHSSLLTNGSWRKGEKVDPFEIRARGRVDFKNLLSLSQSKLFSEEIRLKAKSIESLSGTGQISFKGRRIPGDRLFSYELELMPKEASFLPKGFSSPLIFKEGTLSFSNLGATLSKVKIQSGNSSLTIDGSLKQGTINLSTSGSIDLKNLYTFLQSPLLPDQMRSQMDEIQELSGGAEFRLKWLGRTKHWINALREGEIRLKGASLQHRKIPVPLSHIEGTLSLSPEQIRCVGLMGKMGDSALTFSGIFSHTFSPYSPQSPQAVATRRLSFQIFSSQLDLDQLLPKGEKTTPISFEKVRDWLSNWSFNGEVNVNRGKYRGLHYRDLTVEMKTVDGKLLIHPFQFKADGGEFLGEVMVQPREKGIRFEVRPRISNMEANAFLRTLLQKGEEEKVVVTGRLHIHKVELRGEGEDFKRAKESLNGMLRLELENGVIEKGNILAKIFSILNVSQLFKGRLPDLKTKGLPYHQIIGNIHVKDGIASTEDFLVDSDAMRITIVGKVDLGKNMIDARIGVHPLVTLDTVLSHVPIAGYILTGKDKAFLSYVYEVKGDLNDPKIEATPIKSIGEGFLGIVKRLLETPLRPFQKSPSSK